MLYIGIDWSQEKHDVCICNEAGAHMSRFAIPHSLEGFRKLDTERRKLGVPSGECLVGIETAHNILVDFLTDQGYSIYIIAPQSIEGYRKISRRSGAYDDRSDAALLAWVVRMDRAAHRHWRPNEPVTQQLLAHVRLAAQLQHALHQQQNQLRAALLRTYPAALQLFGYPKSYFALEFLAAYPTAEEAMSLSFEDFVSFCHQHGSRQRQRIAARYVQLHEESPVASPAAVQAHRLQVQVLATTLLAQLRLRNQVLRQLGKLFAQHPDSAIFASLPGAGALLAPSLLAKFGDDRERFPHPSGLQALAGTCPITKRSGTWKEIRYRRSYDREFRRIAQQYARSSLRQSSWAQAYWNEIRPRCRSDSHATRILANRWLAIIWRLWQDRCPYDEAYHLQQRLRRRQAVA